MILLLKFTQNVKQLFLLKDKIIFYVLLKEKIKTTIYNYSNILTLTFIFYLHNLLLITHYLIIKQI